MNDCVLLEMRMAQIMAEQEASGFRFDVEAAERVRAELQQEADNIQAEIAKRYMSTYLARFIHPSVQTRLKVISLVHL